MKHSIRTRFNLGMIFLFMIILVLAVFSGYYLNKLSNKTGAILKENYLSVVYAREMSEGITNINQEVTSAFLISSNPDSTRIVKELTLTGNSLKMEKSNITEPGEDKLVDDIDSEFTGFREMVLKASEKTISTEMMNNLLRKAASLQQKLLQLSQMNGNAIEAKTDEAKSYSKSALTKMTILASMCFLIGITFTFSFASYFSQRFYQLYNGIKELVASNFDQHLYFYEHDEFYDISLVFNEMADMLKENKQKLSVTLQDNIPGTVNYGDLDELKTILFRIKIAEEQTATLIEKIERKHESDES